MVIICKNCEFAERVDNPQASGLTGLCLSEDAPVTEYIEGYKACGVINNDGKCHCFQSRAMVDDGG